ncbi:uncharacterized protein RAG0_13794 [Rhynchosporium agropyri]|uniref:Uncharacterized protein n=1 Tax=Rhynchosporium agropyri TaxID=914238 RepID=A0A1E1LE80_9HELO|nr:uncharacterized protein RAG0_13794 [Rhynchosporium agropyri]
MEVATHMQNISEISDETLTSPNFTADKLAIMKLRNAEFFENRDYSSAPMMLNGERRRSSFSSKTHDHGRSSSQARSSRRISSSAHRSGSFRQVQSGHKSSMELTRQAEGKFFALMDLVSSASREASSLKDIWSGLVSERESLTREREELLETINDVTESLERTESEYHHHGHEHEQRKKQVEKLLIELSLAMNTISENEKRNTSRDHDLLQTRNELHNLRSTLSSTTIAHDKFRSDYEASELKIRALEDERDHAKTNAEKYQEDWRALTREHTDVKSKLTDSTIKLETVRREVISITERLRISENDRDTHLHEKESSQELLRKANLKHEETSLELLNLTEQNEQNVREITKMKEIIRELESDVARHTNTVDNLRRELKTKTTSFNEAEMRTQEMTLKFEHLRRESTITNDKLSNLEQERVEQSGIIDAIREELRVALVEKDSIRDEGEIWKHRADDHQRLINRLQETLRRNVTSLVEVRSEVQTLTSRLSDSELQRSSAHEQHTNHTNEIASLKEKLLILQAELRTTHEGRDRLQEELHEAERRYETVTETMTEFHNSSGSYESEIEHLRSTLHESRVQKERAIAARNTADRERDAADRERDDYIARYEEKCREMEGFVQSSSSGLITRMQSGSAGGGEVTRSSTRVVQRSGTMNTSGTVMHNSGEEDSHGHGHKHNNGTEGDEHSEHSGSME